MVRYRLILILALSIISYTPGLFSQELLMEEKVESDSPSSNLGPNKRHFIEGRIFYGLVNTWEQASYRIELLGSGEFEAQARYKLKLSPVFSTGINLAILNQQLLLDKRYHHPDSAIVRGIFKINSLKPAIFIRFNIDPKRGNYLGKYIETGLYGSWSFSMKKILTREYEVEDELGTRKSREVQSGLIYLDRLNYGSYVSLGWGNYEISYRHRYSWIVNKKAYPSDPRIDFRLWDFPKNSLGLSVRIGQ